MTYAELELSLRRQGEACAVELCFQLDRASAEARLADDALLVRFDDTALLAAQADPSSYGEQLQQMLFADPGLRAMFVEARRLAEGAGHPLRLRLRLDAADAALHALRWETLCDPAGGGFLCTSERLLVSRYLDSADMDPLGMRPPSELRALVAVASPLGLEHYPQLAPIDVAGEIALSRAALAGIPLTLLARETVGRPTTLDAIVEALRDGPDILYLVAHGTLGDGEAAICLEGDDGQVDWVLGDELVARLANLADRPLLVVLASCQSATPHPVVGALAAIGPGLAAAGIAAVVAMQGNITMQTVADFMPVFFRELRRDGMIDRAFAAARASVQNRPDWWMPVLFLRVPNGMLWQTPEPPALPAAPQPERPPETSSFVGRATELAALAAQLAATHVVELTGMPGVGKTALAAALAQRVAPSPEQIFWHSFRSGEGAEALLWALAGFLAWRGQPEPWARLQSDGPPPPTDVLFDYLVPLLNGRGYLLCLDDFQYVDDDPQLDQFIAQLRPLLRAGTLTLLVISRRAPAFASLSEVELLVGLGRDDARLLIAARDLNLPDPLFAQLYEQTGGNAQLLILAIDALRRTRYPERLVADLIDADDLVRYLMHEVDANLSAAERQLMQAAAILLDYGGTRGALKALLDGQAVRPTLLALSERYLLTAIDGPAGQEYRPHAMVQAFYYDDLERRERDTLHRRAATYYTTEERDALRAALHFERAGDDARAADLACAEATALINRGQAQPLRQLLERFIARQHEPTDPRRLDNERWIRLNLACGEVYARLRAGEQARECFQTAVELLAALPDTTASRERTATACRGMAEVLEYEAPQEALIWLQRGVAAAAELPEERGILLLREGSLQISLGALDAAAAALEQSLELLPVQAALWRGKVQLNLGVVACMRGDLAHGAAHFRQAEALFLPIHDDWDLATVWQNLGRVQALTGDWPGAADTYRQALELAVRMGNGTRQAALEYCLGTLATNQGAVDPAVAHLMSCLSLARAQNLREHIVSALAVLADLRLRLGDLEVAAGALDEAEQLALEMKANDQLPEIYRLVALLQLGRGDAEASEAGARHALALASVLGDPLAIGMILRVLGQALAAQGRRDDADAAFARSLEQLADLDQYEAARTRALWGAARTTEQSAAQTLLETARAVFAQLGAQRDLDEVAAALAGFRASAGEA